MLRPNLISKKGFERPFFIESCPEEDTRWWSWGDTWSCICTHCIYGTSNIFHSFLKRMCVIVNGCVRAFFWSRPHLCIKSYLQRFFKSPCIENNKFELYSLTFCNTSMFNDFESQCKWDSWNTLYTSFLNNYKLTPLYRVSLKGLSAAVSWGQNKAI